MVRTLITALPDNNSMPQDYKKIFHYPGSTINFSGKAPTGNWNVSVFSVSVTRWKPNTKFFDLKQNQFLEEIWLFLWFHLNLATLWSKQVETKYMSAWMWLTDTSQTMTVPSFAPVASLDPLWENLRNQTYDKTTDTHYFSQSCVLNVSLFSNTCWYYGVHWEERMVRFTLITKIPMK